MVLQGFQARKAAEEQVPKDATCPGFNSKESSSPSSDIRCLSVSSESSTDAFNEEVDLDEVDVNEIASGSMDTILYQTSALALLYMSFGFAVFFTLQDWTWVDSLYFVVVTLTTVGFGDVNHHQDMTQGAILFTAL